MSDTNKAEQTPSRIEDRIYADSAGKENGPYGPELKPGLERLAAAELHDAAKTDALRTETAKFFQELQIPPNEAERLHTRMVHHHLNPADDETVSNWEKESKERLRSAYGDEASARLKAAKEYLSSRGYDKALNKSGVGSHPDIVMAIVDKAWRLKQEGRLK